MARALARFANRDAHRGARDPMTPGEGALVNHPAVARLTLEEKASLVSGATFWTTTSIDHAGIEGVTLTDGPHGVRFQRPDDGSDHLGMGGSAPATAFP